MTSKRRRLVAVDDPLATASAPSAAGADEVTAAADGRPVPVPLVAPVAPATTVALYVRLRTADADRLSRAAFELRAHKREIVGALIASHVDATTAAGREELGSLLAAHRQICA